MKQKIFKIILSAVAGLLMLAAIFLVVRKNNGFQLTAVKIYNNYFVTKEDIARLAILDFSKDLFEIDLKKMAAQISTHPMIEKVSISRFYPSVLKIRIKEYQLLTGVAGWDVVAIAETRKLIFEYTPEALYDLPMITGIHLNKNETQAGLPENQKLLGQAVQILKMIKKSDPNLYSEISEINFSQDNGMMFLLRKGNLPVILGNSNYLKKLNYFATVYYYFLETKKFNQIQTIDVRFDGEVVVKQKS